MTSSNLESARLEPFNAAGVALARNMLSVAVAR
jgi:hypothetical protein